MKRFLAAVAVAWLAAASLPADAHAQFPGQYGFIPYGFYQPYGARYDTGIRTPPYFATNPPVYYGARHARPYGLSPFAAPPQVVARDDYRTRLRTQFVRPPVTEPLCNPYISPCPEVVPSEEVPAPEPTQLGKVRSNPFVESEGRLAQR